MEDEESEEIAEGMRCGRGGRAELSSLLLELISLGMTSGAVVY